MTEKQVAERIFLPEKAIAAAESIEISEREYEKEKELFYKHFERFLEKWKKRTDGGKYTWALRFYLRLSAEAREVYGKENISPQVFDWTFYDITIWCQECFRKHGVYGVEELGWLAQSVKLRLFRLGRLQFEPITAEKVEKEIGICLPKGAQEISVHIPAGEPLDHEMCVDSFRRAEKFFRERGEGGRLVYLCDSWLLSPALREILPSESNILRFQTLFQIVKVHHAFPQAEERIFGEVKEDKSRYPEITSLQKKAKKYFMEGKDLGIGVGIRGLEVSELADKVQDGKE